MVERLGTMSIDRNAKVTSTENPEPDEHGYYRAIDTTSFSDKVEELMARRDGISTIDQPFTLDDVIAVTRMQSYQNSPNERWNGTMRYRGPDKIEQNHKAKKKKKSRLAKKTKQRNRK